MPNPFAAFSPFSLDGGNSAAGDPLMRAVLLTSDGCYAEFNDGCLLTVLAHRSEITIEEIPDHV